MREDAGQVQRHRRPSNEARDLHRLSRLLDRRPRFCIRNRGATVLGPKGSAAAVDESGERRLGRRGQLLRLAKEPRRRRRSIRRYCFPAEQESALARGWLTPRRRVSTTGCVELLRVSLIQGQRLFSGHKRVAVDHSRGWTRHSRVVCLALSISSCGGARRPARGRLGCVLVPGSSRRGGTRPRATRPGSHSASRRTSGGRERLLRPVVLIRRVRLRLELL